MEMISPKAFFKYNLNKITIIGVSKQMKDWE